MTYYIKGGSKYNEANPKVWVGLFLGGFLDSDYLNANWKDIDYDLGSPTGVAITNQDPFWRMGGSAGGVKELEIGLYNDFRIKFETTGISYWDGDSWEDLLAEGGASSLNELGDVVIDAPADNELLSWDNGTTKWINQTAGEAGLATSGHNHNLNDLAEKDHISLANVTAAQHHAKYTDGDAKSAVTFGDVDSGTDFNSHSEQVKAGFHIIGGGTITVDGSYRVGWTQRMLVMNAGRGTHFSTDGFFQIDQPTSGVITAVGGGTANTWNASGIIITGWNSLYYILPIGSGSTSIAANFRMVGYTSDLEIPDDWILIAKKNHEGGAEHIKFGVGIQLNLSETWVQGTASMIKYTNAEAVQAVEDAGLVLSATKVITSQNADLTFTFGRAQIDSRFADYMAISHRDMSGQDEWALSQHKLGDTFLNAPTGKALYFNINNVFKMSMSATSLAMSVPIAMGANDITLGAGQLVDGKDVSTLGTDAQAKTHIESVGLSMGNTLVMNTNSITLGEGELVDGVDVSVFKTAYDAHDGGIIEDKHDLSTLIFGDIANMSRYTDGEAQGVSINNLSEDTTPQLGGDLDLNDKVITIKTFPSTDHHYEGTVVEWTNVQLFGKVVYHFNSAHVVALADCDDVNKMPAVGITVGTNKTLISGIVRDDSWAWSKVGQPVYVSDSPGVLTENVPGNVGDYVQVIGIITSTDSIYVNVSLDMVKRK